MQEHPSSMAEAVKTEMKRATNAEGGSIERKRGAYEKITPESKAKIAKYAAENGIAAAIRHFENNQAFPRSEGGRKPTVPVVLLKRHLTSTQRLPRSTDTVKSPSEAQIQ